MVEKLLENTSKISTSLPPHRPACKRGDLAARLLAHDVLEILMTDLVDDAQTSALIALLTQQINGLNPTADADQIASLQATIEGLQDPKPAPPPLELCPTCNPPKQCPTCAQPIDTKGHATKPGGNYLA